MIRILEICGHRTDDERDCDRVLGEGEICPDHPTAGVVVETWDAMEERL